MKDKLLSILKGKKEKGFTLVELLIVIAIIAILVLLVIVAIDPLERIRDANDDSAGNSVRSAASAVAACVTKEQATGGSPFTAGNCNDATFMNNNGYISNPASIADVTLTTNGSDNICAVHDNPNGSGDVSWSFQDGQVTDPGVALTNGC